MSSRPVTNSIQQIYHWLKYLNVALYVLLSIYWVLDLSGGVVSQMSAGSFVLFDFDPRSFHAILIAQFTGSLFALMSLTNRQTDGIKKLISSTKELAIGIPVLYLLIMIWSLMKPFGSSLSMMLGYYIFLIIPFIRIPIVQLESGLLFVQKRYVRLMLYLGIGLVAPWIILNFFDYNTLMESNMVAVLSFSYFLFLSYLAR